MSRISREALNMQIAMLVAKRGTCKRLQVGAVITKNNKLISTGYNGPGKEEEHCNEFQCNTDEPCNRAIHAERNALYNIEGEIYPWDTLVLYCTHQPCYSCAGFIVESGIKKVYYLNQYREISGIDLLIGMGVEVIHIDENGETQDPS